MLQLNNVEKVFETRGQRTWILRRIQLEIKQGDFVSIMGPSGAGKSTLLHVLGMYDFSWTGEYWFDGHPVHQLSKKDRLELQKRNIGFVFQSYHLLDDLTVYENIELPLTYRNMPSGQRKSLVGDMLDRFQIVGKKDLYPSQLSGGQQQLVGIARALIASPKLILADEPTGNLHQRQAKEIMEIFRKLNQEDGVTIVQVTHSETNAAYGGKIVEIVDGWIDGQRTADTAG